MQSDFGNHDCLSTENITRIGRANYVCGACKTDISLQVVLLYEALNEEKDFRDRPVITAAER